MNIKYIWIIIGLSVFIYLNTLNNEFVSDDVPGIVNNPNIAHVFLAHDVPGLLNSLNYKMARLNPPIYHLTNIALHSLNSILVFFFLGLFFKPAPSFWGSLLFATHPIHTEAVTWISGRPYLVSSLFFLLSFFLYLNATSAAKLNPALSTTTRRYSETRKGGVRIGSLLGSLFLYFLALRSIALAHLYPGMLVLYDFTFARWRKTWKIWLTFFVLTFIDILFKLEAIKYRIATVSFDTGSTALSNPLFNMAYSIFSHLGLLIWPLKLTLYHEPLTISQFCLGLEIFLLALIILSLPLFFKKAKPLFFAICFFILFLTPTYSPVTLSWLVAERYLYFPSLALSIAVAYLLTKSLKAKKTRIVLNIMLLLLITGYSIRTLLRNNDWRTHDSIWRATLKVSTQSPRAHINMGDVYYREENLAQAVEEFRQAIELKPNYADAHHNLAHTYEKMGKIEEAIINYQKAITMNPQLWQSYQNLGVIYLEQGKPDLAKEYLQKALEVKPQ